MLIASASASSKLTTRTCMLCLGFLLLFASSSFAEIDGGGGENPLPPPHMIAVEPQSRIGLGFGLNLPAKEVVHVNVRGLSLLVAANEPCAVAIQGVLGLDVSSCLPPGARFVTFEDPSLDGVVGFSVAFDPPTVSLLRFQLSSPAVAISSRQVFSATNTVPCAAQILDVIEEPVHQGTSTEHGDGHNDGDDESHHMLTNASHTFIAQPISSATSLPLMNVMNIILYNSSEGVVTASLPTPRSASAVMEGIFAFYEFDLPPISNNDSKNESNTRHPLSPPSATPSPPPSLPEGVSGERVIAGTNAPCILPPKSEITILDPFNLLTSYRTSSGGNPLLLHHHNLQASIKASKRGGGGGGGGGGGESADSNKVRPWSSSSLISSIPLHHISLLERQFAPPEAQKPACRGCISIGKYFTLETSSLKLSSSSSSLEATLQYSFTNEELEDYGVEPDSLRFAYFDETSGEWHRVESNGEEEQQKDQNFKSLSRKVISYRPNYLQQQKFKHWTVVGRASKGKSFCDLRRVSLLEGSPFSQWSGREICQSMGTIVPNVTATGTITVNGTVAGTNSSSSTSSNNSTSSPSPPPPPPIYATCGDDILSLPFFDWRRENSTCVTPAINQQKCGGCWGIASTSVLAMRLCILMGGKRALSLSSQEMIDCDTTCESFRCQDGCRGGYVDLAWKYLIEKGVGLEECYPWESTQGSACRSGYCAAFENNRKKNGISASGRENKNNKEKEKTLRGNHPTLPIGIEIGKDIQESSSSPPSSPSSPSSVYSSLAPDSSDQERLKDPPRYYAQEYHTFSSISEIMCDIYKSGPVMTSLEVREDFLSYGGSGGVNIVIDSTTSSSSPTTKSAGVYESDRTARIVGTHSIVLLGWGIENGVHYWVGKNSWGEDWGEKGFFKIRRGIDESLVESRAIAGSTFPQDYLSSAAFTSCASSSSLHTLSPTITPTIFLTISVVITIILTDENVGTTAEHPEERQQEEEEQQEEEQEERVDRGDLERRRERRESSNNNGCTKRRKRRRTL